MAKNKIQENPEIKEAKKEAEKVEPVKIESGKVAFIKEGVTIFRDISQAGKLASMGFKRK